MVCWIGGEPCAPEESGKVVHLELTISQRGGKAQMCTSASHWPNPEGRGREAGSSPTSVSIPMHRPGAQRWEVFKTQCWMSASGVVRSWVALLFYSSLCVFNSWLDEPYFGHLSGLGTICMLFGYSGNPALLGVTCAWNFALLVHDFSWSWNHWNCEPE